MLTRPAFHGTLERDGEVSCVADKVWHGRIFEVFSPGRPWSGHRTLDQIRLAKVAVMDETIFGSFGSNDPRKGNLIRTFIPAMTVMVDDHLEFL